MTDLSADARTCFVGYGLTNGRAGGTLSAVPQSQIIEAPVAENLMTGVAVGLALAGRRPLVYFERFDFVLNAADAIVNHLSAMRTISQGEFSPAVILRVVVGNRRKPLFTGATHTQDFSQAFREMVNFPVYQLHGAAAIRPIYADAARRQSAGESTMIVEYKDML